MCNLKEPSEWPLIVSFCTLATAQPHNGYGLSKEEFESLCCKRTSASSFDTADNMVNEQNTSAKRRN